MAGTAVVFGHDWAESTVIKRIRSFTALGLEVFGFSFRREKFNQAFVPFWENVHLGTTTDRAYAKRLPKLLGALPLLFRHRAALRAATFIYARNIDMCSLAVLARFLSRSEAPLVYEVLDIQRIFIGWRPANYLMRWLERRVLKRCDLLVVSSPGFMARYFTPVQGYRGRSFLLENKISFAKAKLIERPVAGMAVHGAGAEPAKKWVIGWFGTLRCPKSLDMLCRLAEALPERVEIYMRGYPTETGLAVFEEAIARHPNMTYGGEYRNPEDLAEIYGKVHLTWAFDFLDEGSNSKWLLPNRIYEGGYYGSVALAEKGTETGDKVRELGLGYAFDGPLLDNLIAFLRWYSWDEHLARRQHILSLPRREFCDLYDTRDLCEMILGLAERRGGELLRQSAGPGLRTRTEERGGR